MADLWMPRLGEDATRLWERFRATALGGTPSPHGVLYAVARIVPGPVYSLHGDELYIDADPSGVCIRRATAQEEDELQAALSQDQVQVYTRTRPGRSSGYRPPQVVEVLHEPRGRAFLTLNPSKAAA